MYFTTKEELERLKAALDQSSVNNRNLLITYLVLTAYILITVAGTTDVTLLLGTSVKLPLLNLGISLVWFYIAAPFMLTALHFNLLFNLLQHMKKLIAYDTRSPGTAHRMLLYPFLVNYRVTVKRGYVNYILLNLFTWLLYNALPLITLVLIQRRYSSVYSALMNVWHYFLLTVTVITLLAYWHRIVDARYLSEKYETISGTLRFHWRFGLLRGVRHLWLSVPCLIRKWGRRLKHFIKRRRGVGGNRTNRYRRRLYPMLGRAHGNRPSRSSPLLVASRFGILTALLAATVNLVGLMFLKLNVEDKFSDLRRKTILDGGRSVGDLQIPEHFCGPIERIFIPVPAESDTCVTSRRIFLRIQSLMVPPLSLNGKKLQAVLRIRPRRQAAGRSRNDMQASDEVLIDLSGRDLRHADFSKARLTGADFRNANLKGADFSEANLHSAKFDQANLNYVSFHKADMRAASLVAAKMKRIIFLRADMQGADLSRTVLESANLDHVRLAGAVLENTGLKFASAKYADFRGARIIHKAGKPGRKPEPCADNDNLFKYVDFAWANFTGARIQGVGACGANFAHSRFSGARVLGLSLQSSSLAYANFLGARFEPRTLNGVIMAGTTMCGTRPSSLWHLFRQHHLGWDFSKLFSQHTIIRKPGKIKFLNLRNPKYARRVIQQNLGVIPETEREFFKKTLEQGYNACVQESKPAGDPDRQTLRLFMKNRPAEYFAAVIKHTCNEPRLALFLPIQLKVAFRTSPGRKPSSTANRIGKEENSNKQPLNYSDCYFYGVLNKCLSTFTSSNFVLPKLKKPENCPLN